MEVVITKVITDEYIADFAVLVHKFIEMESLNVVFALAQMADRIYLVARSRIDEVNSAEIAQAFEAKKAARAKAKAEKEAAASTG